MVGFHFILYSEEQERYLLKYQFLLYDIFPWDYFKRLEACSLWNLASLDLLMKVLNLWPSLWPSNSFIFWFTSKRKSKKYYLEPTMIGFPVLSIFWILSRRPLSFGFFVEISAGECIKESTREARENSLETRTSLRRSKGIER